MTSRQQVQGCILRSVSMRQPRAAATCLLLYEHSSCDGVSRGERCETLWKCCRLSNLAMEGNDECILHLFVFGIAVNPSTWRIAVD